MILGVFSLLTLPLTSRVGRVGRQCSGLTCRLQCSASFAEKLYASLSFFEFTPLAEDALDAIVERAAQTLTSIGAKGTLYVAPEGYNGQFAIEADHLPDFSKSLADIDPVLGRVELNLANVSTFKDSEFPFKKLLVKKRKFILTDNFDLDLDWKDYGVEAPAEEYHQLLQSDDVVVLDCRNDYESDVGKFDKAIPLNTSVFSESWVPGTHDLILFCVMLMFRRPSIGYSSQFPRIRRY